MTVTTDWMPAPNYIASRPRDLYGWERRPRWMFWRPKWRRWVVDHTADRDSPGVFLCYEYADDADRLKSLLEETFGAEANQN